jgi:PAS domain S-box-containing protein
MKRYLVIDGDGDDLERAVGILREQGLNVALTIDPEGFRGKTENRSGGEYRDFLESAPIGIFRSTPEGKLISVNRALARLLKYDSPEDLVETVNRRSIAEVLYPEPAKRREVVEDLLSQEGWQVYELQCRCRDESIITCRDYIRKVPGARGVTELEGFVEDITDRKKAEDALRLSQFVIDKASIGIMRGDGEARILFANEYSAKALGYSQEELCSMSFFDIDPNLTGEFWQEHRKRLTVTGINTFESVQRRKDGTTFPVEVTVNYLKFGEHVFSCSFSRDITDRKRTEDALRRSEEKYRAVADFTYDWETWTSPDGKLIYVSPSCERITGHSADDFMNDPELMKRIVHPDDHTEFARHFEGVLKEDTPVRQSDFRIITRDGEERWIEHICQPVFASDGRWLGRRASNRDATERKRAEEKIKTALAEKEVLLKEVHHRVKNNLQIITTLLDLQSDTIQEEETRRYIMESQSRIRSISIAYEQLYRSKDINTIDFARYADELVNWLGVYFHLDQERVNIQLDMESLRLDMDRAIPCGLIVNELVSNAVKHAFPGEKRGEITVSCRGEGDGKLLLEIGDNGIGFPDGLDLRNAETLGLLIVNLLVRQLNGEMEIRNEGGALFVIRFPAEYRA